MPLPRWLAEANRRGLNRIVVRVAGRLPHFAVVEHRGRRSGRVYRTPVNLHARPGGYAAALTYGPSSQWVQNVLAAGGATLETGGRRVRVTNPRLVRDPSRRWTFRLARPILRRLNVEHFLFLDADPAPR